MKTLFLLASIGLGILLTGQAEAASVVGGPVVNAANGHIYYLLDQSTWTDAQATAVSLGGNLVTINDAAENTFVFQTFGTGRDLWIGYNDAQTEGTFTWISGETPSYTNWRDHQPDNFSDAPVPGEDYAHIYGTQTAFGGQWNDAANDPSVYAGFTFANEVADIQGVVEVNPVPLPPALLSGLGLCGAMLLARTWRRGVAPAA